MRRSDLTAGRALVRDVIRIALPHETEFNHVGEVDYADNQVDPNTGTELFESADIVRYLEETYVAR